MDAEVDRLLDEALGRARAILGARRGLLDDLAARLLEVETMTGAELAEVIASHATVELRGVVAVPRPAPPAEPALVAVSRVTSAPPPRAATVPARTGTRTTGPPPWLRTLLRVAASALGGHPGQGGVSG